MEVKTCSRCKENKPFDDFCVRKRSKTGRASACKKCTNESVALFNRQDNYQRARNGKKKYIEKIGKDKINEINKKWRKENREAFLNSKKRSRETNKDAIKAYNAKRRARKLKATVLWANYQYIQDLYSNAREASSIFQNAGLTVTFEVDHIVPLLHNKVCGLHVEDNLQILTSVQNRQKSNKFMVG